MRVVDVKIDGNQGTVILESPKPAAEAIQELLSPEAKALALQEARKAGLLQAGHGIVPYPYPVDVNGNVVPPDGSSLPVAYRIDIPVVSAAL